MKAATRRVGRPLGQIELAQRYVTQSSLVGVFCAEGAVDLARVAQARKVHTIELRPLLAEGCLIPDIRGFTVQINHSERVAIDPTTTTLKDDELTTRQRFTIAHEIAHTLVYDLNCAPPRKRAGVLQTILDIGGGEPSKSLEDFCQISAGMILTPTSRLKSELAPSGTVDSIEVILRLAKTFRVSPEVLIHRVDQIAETDLIRAADYALFMVSAVDGADQVRAYVYSWTLRGILEPPKRYSKFKPWIERTRLPIEIADTHEGTWNLPVPQGELHVRKIRHSHNASYFVEVALKQPLALRGAAVAVP